MGSDSNNPFIGTSTEHDLRIISNNTEQMRIKSDGKVGIGTNAPARQLHTTESGDSIVRVEGGATSAVGIEFLNSGKDATQLYSTNENLQIFTNGTERIRVESDGDVGIGTTAPAEQLHVIGNGRFQGVDPTVRFKTTSTSNKNLQLTTTHSSGTTYLDLRTNNDAFNSGVNKLIFSENGINFPNGTSSAERTSATALDYYEEGTFTAGLRSDSGAGTITLNSSFNTLAYTRIGRVVYITGKIKISALSGSYTNKRARITGLPFSAANLTEGAGASTFTVALLAASGGGDGTDVGQSIEATIDEGESHITLEEADGTTVSITEHFKVGDQIYVSGHYFAN